MFGDVLISGVIVPEESEAFVPASPLRVGKTGTAPGTMANRGRRVAVIAHRNQVFIPKRNPVKNPIWTLMQYLNRMSDRRGHIEATVVVGLDPSIVAVPPSGPILALLAILPVPEPLLLLGRVPVVHRVLIPPTII